MQLWLACNSESPPASASQVLGWKACDTKPNSTISLILLVKQRLHEIITSPMTSEKQNKVGRQHSG